MTRTAVSRRRVFLFAVYGLLLSGGLLLGGRPPEFAYFYVHPGNEASVHRMIMTVTAVYILVSALPFVPGAEIGLSLMLMLGPKIAGLVYLSTVLALTLAYLVGRAIPAASCAAAFNFFGFRKARELVLQMAALNAGERLQLLLAHAPPRIVAILLRHRYLALAAAFNLPGNTLVGGGGGIALAAGMSGLYPLPHFLLTTALAVAPVPLTIGLTGVLR